MNNLFKTILFSVLLYACGNSQNDRGYIVQVGDEAPNFEVQMQDSSTLKLADLKGKVVMLQFTASWCPVCRKEMPLIESEIWQQYKERDDFYLIALARKDTLPNMLGMIEKTGITYPITLDVDDKVFTKYAQVKAGVTRNIIIDKQGNIQFLTRLFERQEFDEMKAKIGELLQ